MGRALCRQLKELGIRVDATSRRKDASHHLDMTEDLSDWTPPGQYDVCFLFAAIAQLDTCEKEPEKSRHINVEKTVDLAEKLIRNGCRIVFPSTSQVFDGTEPAPEIESPLSPAGEYGRQKAEAEARLLALDGEVFVIRYAKVLPPATPLLTAWRSALANGETITPFSDLHFAPVPLDFALEATLAIATQGKPGIWHISGAEDVSYAQAAQWVSDDAGASPSQVRPITIAESGANVTPIKFSMLGVARLKDELNITPPSVRQTILHASRTPHE